ncbi:related to Fumarylacetoacetase [Phialocephala subalpina]|uniref:Fumarylacetoacetase n=1 Tax=Phialocephala subalpina TaxID=576137 RepID=A0A1L7XNH4_9HELO|nr:related to Fumarylacetoacetase [Phialocephala subalpina]
MSSWSYQVMRGKAILCETRFKTDLISMHVAWPVEVGPGSPFPITNIPFGIFSTQGSPDRRAGIAIGEYILDLSCLEEEGLFQDTLQHEEISNSWSHNDSGMKKSIFDQASLNNFAALPPATRSAIRNKIIEILQNEHSKLFSDPAFNHAAFHKQSNAQMHLSMQIGDFTDFMCSRTHGDNCSRLAGIPEGLPASFYAFPTAYNGRSSSLIISGIPVHRPSGMLRVPSSNDFEFGPTRRMDYELELGFFVSKPVEFGKMIKSADEAKEHIFGFVLMNDWSARDIQFAEMTPLGPFNGKGSATTISPWVVTLDALREVEIVTSDDVARERMAELPLHLRHDSVEQTWSINVEVALKREGYEKAVTLARSDLKDLYWSPAQMLAHQASPGCGLRTGDLLGTGTISSPVSESSGISSLGCLHEMTTAGTKPFLMSNGDAVTWLEDGDEVVMTGRVVRSDGSIIGFGECRGVLESPLAGWSSL